MPQVTLLDEPAPLLLPMQGRSDAIHVSDIIKDLCIRLGLFGNSDVDLRTEWAELGNALEHSIISRMQLDKPDRYVTPGEVELDGIPGTPDLLDCATPYSIQEIKAAWMSSVNGPGSKKFWRYETQLRCYCHMLEIGSGRLAVYFVNGDYRSAGPVYCEGGRGPWLYSFTRQELAENWRMIVKHRDRMLRERERKARQGR